MGRDFLPRPDAAFRDWSANFLQQLEAAPNAYGAPADLVAGYRALHEAMVVAMDVVALPETRTPVAVNRKNQKRKLAADAARRLAGLIQRHVGLASDQRLLLGLSQPGRRGAQVGAPDVPPDLKVWAENGGRALRVSFGRRPRGAALATVYLHLNDEPTLEMMDWRAMASTSRTTLTVTLPPGEATTAWLSARWSNAKGEPGPFARAMAIDVPRRQRLPANGQVMLTAAA